MEANRKVKSGGKGGIFVIIVALVVVLAGLARPAAGTTWYVDANGFADFNSIQAAISDAGTVNGDEIEVAPGTYYEAINFNGKAVRLYSSGGAEVTTIDANGAYHAVQCVSDEDANTVLEGFTITGGDANGTAPDNCGAGIYCVSSSPTVNNCTISGNTAYDGGGMYNDGSSPTLTSCTFLSNTVTHNGGGMYNLDNSNPTMTDCSFTDNNCPGYGGGICNVLSSSPALTNCNFTENHGGGGGGMINSVDCSPTIINCVYIGNSANYGGGIYNNDSNPIVSNCTFTNNEANTGGGAMDNRYSSPTVTNCIFWGDTPNEIYDDGHGSGTVTYSDVQGGYIGTGNIDVDPVFLDAANGDLRLCSCSPCVDAGDSDAVPSGVTTDLDGNPRFVDDVNVPDTGTGTPPIVDMGAYERQISSLAPICNVTKGVWYCKIQAAIDDANDYDEIEVGPGTYYEAIHFNGNAVRLYSSGGADVTTIDANGAYHAVQCVSGEDANTILEGFTITGGNANGSYPDNGGGGMYNYQSSPTVTNCIFTGNTANEGGGMYNCDGSSPTVTNCSFSNNTGGGMRNFNSGPTVTNCTFSGNTAAEGAGMYNIQSSPTVTNCAFSGNTAAWGGGMYNRDSSSPTVTNCTFSGNSAGYNGGGMYNFNGSSPTVTNCTFSGNTAYYGGGMYNEWSSPTLANCILWGDTNYEIYDYSGSASTVNYCDVEGGTGQGWFGTGCIDADPCFIDANSGDFRLGPGSPCIDAGNNTAVPSSVLKDLAGKLRFADDPYTPDAGYAGDTGRPVVDMGAYEYQGCGAIPQNLLANPGFETGDATGWMASWGLEADGNQVHDGNYSGLASGRTATWDGAWQSVLGLMDDGKTYRISGWVMLQNADSNYVQLTVKKTDSDGTNFYFIDSATGFDDQWVHLDGTLALDVNGQPTELFVYFEGPAPDVNFYVDDASVTEVTGELNHNGGVDFFDFSLFASYYRFDCSTQDCGLANLYDCDKAINERDLAILIRDWLVGVE